MIFCSVVIIVSSNAPRRGTYPPGGLASDQSGALRLVRNGNLTWAYRAIIGALFLIFSSLVGWNGKSLKDGQNEIRAEIATLKTDRAGDAGVLMRIKGQIGAPKKRIGRIVDAINQIRDRLTILETKSDDHVRTAARVR
jgi:hypothetical protein